MLKKWYWIFVLSLSACSVENILEPPSVSYNNVWEPIDIVDTIFGDNPEWVTPIVDAKRYKGAVIVKDSASNIYIRSWRYSFNKRGIVEFDNYLDGQNTALVVVHPWGIDDGGGWQTPKPNGAVLYCTDEKNVLYNKHIRNVLLPFVEKMRNNVQFCVFSLPNNPDSLRLSIYPSIFSNNNFEPSEAAKLKLYQRLQSFNYIGKKVADSLQLNELSTGAYFRSFRGLLLDDYNGKGFDELPVPLHRDVNIDKGDVVVYDGQKPSDVISFFKKKNIQNIILTGYATDFCLKNSIVGYESLRDSFNLYIVGDATMATFPAMSSPSHATSVELARASSYHMITQTSWVRLTESAKKSDK